MSRNLPDPLDADATAADLISPRLDPGALAVEAFRAMVACMRRGDYRTAGTHRGTLRKLGWKIIPPSVWGKGGRP